MRNKDRIFNRRVMYKDRHKTNANDIEQSGLVFANEDGILDIPMT